MGSPTSSSRASVLESKPGLTPNTNSGNNKAELKTTLVGAGHGWLIIQFRRQRGTTRKHIWAFIENDFVMYSMHASRRMLKNAQEDPVGGRRCGRLQEDAGIRRGSCQRPRQATAAVGDDQYANRAGHQGPGRPEKRQ